MVRMKANFVRRCVDIVPPIASWIVTGRCNMRCAHCYPDSGPDYPGPELRFEEQLHAVANLASAGVESVFLSGGEVFLLPALFDLVGEIHRHGMTSWICTNGSLVDRAVAGRIALSGVRGVSVSVDSPEASVHDGFRAHPGAHGKALEAIRLLREQQVTVNVDYTATRVNRQGIEELFLLANALGVKSVFLKRFRPLGRGGRNAKQLGLSLEEYRDVTNRLLRAGRGMRTEVCFEDPAVYAYRGRANAGEGIRPDSLYARIGCLAGVAWLGVQPNGDVTPCPLLPVVLGNVVREDLHRMLGRGDVIPRLKNRDDRDGRCGRCEERWQCGGCRAHALAVAGDPFGEDPFCLRTLWTE